MRTHVSIETKGRMMLSDRMSCALHYFLRKRDEIHPPRR